MEIKKGDWVRCIKSDIGSFTKVEEFTKGKVYRFSGDTHIKGNTGHSFIGVEEWKNDHFIKLYTIQDLKDGKVAVDNTGTVEELNRVLNSAFPNCYKSDGSYSFYNALGSAGWRGRPVCDLPAQSVKDFLVQLPKEVIIEDHDTLNTRREKLGYKPIVNTPINPKHYAFNIKGTDCDVFDIANAMGLNIEQSTALRYFRKKENQIEDTKKAIKCLERLVERLEGERND